GTARSSQQSSANARRSLICDATGKVCVTVQMLPALPSPLPTPASHPADSLTIWAEPLICDASGTICAHSPIVPPNARILNTSSGNASPAIPSATLAATLVARPAIQSSPTSQPAPAASPRPSAKAAEMLNQDAELQVDGARIDGHTATILTDDPFDWVVHVHKSRHLFQVYFRGRLYKVYHAVF